MGPDSFTVGNNLLSLLLKKMSLQMLLNHHQILGMLLKLMYHSGMFYNSTPGLLPHLSSNVEPTQIQSWWLKQMLRFRNLKVVK